MIAITLVVVLAVFGAILESSTVSAAQATCASTAQNASAIVERVRYLRKNQGCPTCGRCGINGTITRIVFNLKRGRSVQLPVCSGCTGKEFLARTVAWCNNFPEDGAKQFLRRFCAGVCPKCSKEIEIYRCGCPAEQLTTPLVTLPLGTTIDDGDEPVYYPEY